jgi:hypothetical protein
MGCGTVTGGEGFGAVGKYSGMGRAVTMRTHFFNTIGIAFLILCIGNTEAKDIDFCPISKLGIGPIHLGMTLRDAKALIPSVEFQRSTDGDGVALITVKVGNEDLMTLFANEDDSAAPIDWSKKISFIETFNPACKTAEGVHPDLLINNVEKILGKTKKIIQSEIESREFIYFQNQPKYLVFRLDYTGIFVSGSRTTKKFAPEGKIFSIAVTKE